MSTTAHTNSWQRPETAADIAHALRQLAELLDRHGSLRVGNAYVAVSIQPHGSEQAEVAAIDGIGRALNGEPGSTREMSSGRFHHNASATIAGIDVSAYTAVTSPAERDMRARRDRTPASTASRTCSVCASQQVTASMAGQTASTPTGLARRAGRHRGRPRRKGSSCG